MDSNVRWNVHCTCLQSSKRVSLGILGTRVRASIRVQGGSPEIDHNYRRKFLNC